MVRELLWFKAEIASETNNINQIDIKFSAFSNPDVAFLASYSCSGLSNEIITALCNLNRNNYMSKYSLTYKHN